MATARRNKIQYRAKASKSFNAFSVFDQLQIQEFKEAFNLIDQDKDGLISANDLKLMFSTLGKADNYENDKVINEMLKECTGPLNFTMFLSLFAEKIGSTDPENVILNAFSMFDPDDTGIVSCNKLKDLITTLGDRYTQDEIEDFLMSAPLTPNGTSLNYKEFSTVLKHGDKNNDEI